MTLRKTFSIWKIPILGKHYKNIVGFSPKNVSFQDDKAMVVIPWLLLKKEEYMKE